MITVPVGTGSGAAEVLGGGVTSCTVGCRVVAATEGSALVADPVGEGDADADEVVAAGLLTVLSAAVVPGAALPQAVSTVSRLRAARGRRGIRAFMQPTFRAVG